MTLPHRFPSILASSQPKRGDSSGSLARPVDSSGADDGIGRDDSTVQWMPAEYQSEPLIFAVRWTFKPYATGILPFLPHRFTSIQDRYIGSKAFGTSNPHVTGAFVVER